MSTTSLQTDALNLVVSDTSVQQRLAAVVTALGNDAELALKYETNFIVVEDRCCGTLSNFVSNLDKFRKTYSNMNSFMKISFTDSRTDKNCSFLIEKAAFIRIEEELASSVAV